ncbi:MAG: sugar phosphate isomerase/epimerase family protein [Kiritimatiellia bacterium]
MKFGISTNWNSKRIESGNAIVDEALELGFDALELGYNLTEEQAGEIKMRADNGDIAIDSVHCYCPVPIGAPHGYPELYLLASLDEDEKVMARINIERTLEFTAKMGARVMVLHAGRIFLNSFFSRMSTHTLADAIAAEGGNDGDRYMRLLEKALKRRKARAAKYFNSFCVTLEALLPRFEEAGVTLALENLPSIEAFPDMAEMLMLKERFDTPALAYWHDIGHAQVREFFRWERHTEVLQALLPFTAGTHIHDAQPLLDDHLPPGTGEVNFKDLIGLRDQSIVKVFEPSPDILPADLKKSLEFMRKVWS